jgi:hypothetical protein
MSTPPNSSGIRDNHRRGSVADFLKAKVQTGSRLSVVSAYFTIYAYEALKNKLDDIEHLDFLFGEPRFIASLDPDKTEKKAFILDGNGLKLANRLQQNRVARECAEWFRRKVDIRSVRHVQLLHGKMYHIANAGVEEAILGSSNFTVRGLGLGMSSNNIELLSHMVIEFPQYQQHRGQRQALFYPKITPKRRVAPLGATSGTRF